MSIQDQHLDLRDLGPEKWGDKLRRARGAVTLAQAAAYVSQYLPCDASTISRMESLPIVPTGGMAARRRQVAYTLCVGLYRVKPSELGLDGDDLPPNVSIVPSDLAGLPTGRYAEAQVIPLLAAA